MRARTLLVALFGLSIALLRAGSATTDSPGAWQLRHEQVGVAADALRLPERAFSSQASRGWQLVGRALDPGRRAVLAASDGLSWSFELRALVKGDAAASLVVGLVFHYEDSRHYTALVWDTRTGVLTLRSLRGDQSRELARGQAEFGKSPWASVVIRLIMGDLVCYINGEKVLAASDPARLGRAAVFAAGADEVQLDGLELRGLVKGETDGDVFARGRAEYETKCSSCHALEGPWSTRFGPDDWEGVIRQMRTSEGADRTISPAEAGRILDYLRLITLHPDRTRYRPSVKSRH